MSRAATTLKITGLAKKKLRQLAADAKRLGMTSEDLAKQVIEEHLELDREAREKTFAEILAPVREDFRKNVPQHHRQGLREYVQWLHRHERPAERLCGAGVPTWVVHAEKGDGGLTDEERSALEACPHAHLVTIPGSVFFLPNEVPERVADVIIEAVGQTG